MHTALVRARHIAAFGGLFLALACSNGTGAGAGLDGTWMHEGVPGSAETVTLTSAGSRVSGSGHWTGEACCSGTVTATGTRQGSAVTLDFRFVTTDGLPVPAREVQFVGRLAGDRLTGTITAPGVSAAYVLERVTTR